MPSTSPDAPVGGPPSPAAALAALGPGPDPDVERALLRAEALLRLARDAEAVAALASWRERRPADWRIPVCLGAAALCSGDAVTAGRRFGEAQALFPVAGELWYHAGMAALRAGTRDAARAAFVRLAGVDDSMLTRRLARVAAAGGGRP